MYNDYDVVIYKGELITSLREINQFCLSEEYTLHSSLGALSIGKFSVEKGIKVAPTRNSLSDIKKSKEKKLGLPSTFPEL